MKRTLLVLLFVVAAFLSPGLYAAVLDLPPSLGTPLLSESVSFVFRPADFAAEDFRVEWEGDPIPGVRIAIGAQSLEWVRVAKVFVIPRAILVVDSNPSESGLITHGGFSQTIHGGHGEIPIALISGPKNSIDLTLIRKGREFHGKVLVRFSPRIQNERKVLLDTSCSPFNIEIDSHLIPRDSWMYLGCRLVYENGPEHPITTLELFVFWDNIGQEVSVGELSLPSSSVSVWSFRLRHDPGVLQIAAKAGAAKLNYHVAERLRLGHLGFGVGPYAYNYEGGTKSANGIVPLLTLYGSYFINEALRFVVFEASPLHTTAWSDTGLYFNVEQIRTFDERLSLNLLLGAHFLTYQFGSSWYWRMSAPQGVELIFRDFVRKNHSVSIGAFVYPPINDTSYYNLWARWGTPGLFVEFNYINWRQKIYSDIAESRAMGISVGMPLKRFF